MLIIKSRLVGRHEKAKQIWCVQVLSRGMSNLAAEPQSTEYSLLTSKVVVVQNTAASPLLLCLFENRFLPLKLPLSPPSPPCIKCL
jgi:hypothetical protein